MIAAARVELAHVALAPRVAEAVGVVLTPAACMSFNYHVDHFSEVWGIRTADGGVAHTGCVGFGMERLTLALLRHHGLDPARWPRAVRERLGGL